MNFLFIAHWIILYLYILLRFFFIYDSRVLRWYLSSFHAGRKSTIAKKPYNPILGETFRCHWHVDESQPPGQPVTDGPLPWCGENELCFIAEQVSHHPPISAFYAEHPSKKISVNAHIYTKSSFLGMSVSNDDAKIPKLDSKLFAICSLDCGAQHWTRKIDADRSR